jgi:thiol-disulfide isomerase/thioredoxin
MKSHHVYVMLAAVAALIGGLLLSSRLHDSGPATAVQQPAAGGEAVLAATFPDLNNLPQPLSQWRGKLLVINFWATWCPPCREEIPGFIRLQRELADKNVQFVGIAIDTGEKVNNFSRELGINYPLLLGEDTALELQRQLGNQSGVLPFTVIIDASGKLVARHLGGLGAEQLKSLIGSPTGHP